ncbi:uncharacterized protein JCM15063_002720 [Sporobolomyces koalae]|uniref:uncharacterized protein n=1 Tax=Sporobolomyces koalae TaxID=500713 RepID=UPI003170EF1B
MPSTPQALSLPRWVDNVRSTLTKNLKENKDLISYALATIDSDSHFPKVRYVVHRGFVNERRKDDDGSNNLVKDDQDNELISDKLVVTTDARTPKSKQLAADPSVEIAWWLAATQHQFRILGKAYILPSPDFSQSSSTKFPFPADKLAPYPGFNWEDERIRQFRKLSPELRASFVRPVPGTSLSDWDGKMEDLPETLVEGHDQAKTDEEKKQLDQALYNFALIVIDASEIDLVDLGAQPNVRTKWFRKQSEGTDKWDEQGVVP